MIVSEVCPTALGTRLSAVGTQYTGPGAKVCMGCRLVCVSLNSFLQLINDKTNVKDNIHLRSLTYSQDDLLILFNNQVATLGEWREAEEEEEKAEGVVSGP